MLTKNVRKCCMYVHVKVYRSCAPAQFGTNLERFRRAPLEQISNSGALQGKCGMLLLITHTSCLLATHANESLLPHMSNAPISFASLCIRLTDESGPMKSLIRCIHVDLQQVGKKEQNLQ